VGDDPLSTRPDPALLAVARERFVAANGEHPMTGADDTYAREHFERAGEESLR
jgi:hypothetical protein